MFCSACGTPNADDAISCRMCGEVLAKRGQIENKPGAFEKLRSVRPKSVWVLSAVLALLATTGFGVYYYRATQEFEVAGQLLYKSDSRVRTVAGARIQVYEDKGKSFPAKNRYSLLLMRQFELNIMDPELYDSKRDAELAPLNLAPLSRMDWTWWESQRLHNCMYAEQVFSEGLQAPTAMATTSSDMNGRFWLKLRRGKYFIAAESEVPNHWRSEHNGFSPSYTEVPTTGEAFWDISVAVTGNVKVVSADPACSPGP